MSLDKRLAEIFSIFQDKEKNAVDVKEIPVILRGLGLVPSESDLKKIVAAMVGEEGENTVHLASFLTVTKRLLLERRYPSCSRSELQKALEVLATEGRKVLEAEDSDPSAATGALSYGDSAKKFYPKGSLPRADLVRLLALDGERLTQDECDEVMVTIPLRDEDCVDTEVYALHLSAAHQNF
ncbi:UNVERIFIED_CONTAM: hypothetical protein RMT77_014674 [Armadillidium vulgare]